MMTASVRSSRVARSVALVRASLATAAARVGVRVVDGDELGEGRGGELEGVEAAEMAGADDAQFQLFRHWR